MSGDIEVHCRLDSGKIITTSGPKVYVSRGSRLIISANISSQSHNDSTNNRSTNSPAANMQSISVSAFALSLLCTIKAQGVDNEFPFVCQSICQPVVTLADQCNTGDGDDDQDDGDCLCGSTAAATQVPQCQACLFINDQNNGRDNGIDPVLATQTISNLDRCQ